MKHVELARKTKSSSHWTRLAAASLLAVAALAGCGGGGSDGATGAAGPAGPVGPTGPTGPSSTATVNLATVSATDWAALTPVATVSSVVINSPPVVTFKVLDGYARPVVGLTTSQVRFSIAKLVPGADGSQSTWVSYMVGDPSTGAPGRPGTENVSANLVDNMDGTYQYTFARDITGPLQTKMAAWFADTANAASAYKKADVMGVDGTLLNYVPTLQHRLAIQLSGSVNGGTLANPVNVIYDFVPATGAVVAAADVQREVVSIDTCNTCHEKLAFHGGGRVDTRYCVVCHTDQRKNGVASVVSTAGSFPALTETKTVNATTGITSYSYAPETRVADGEVVGNFTTMVHKIHNGSALVKQNYNYANVAFNNKAYSMLGDGQKMCSSCHDNTKAKQADNWSTQPSRIACGSCHDGINFADGTGETLAGLKTGHAGINLKQTSDVACTICHSSDTVKEYHRTTNVTKHNPTVAAGLVNFKFEIKSAAVDAGNTVTVKFKISSDQGVLPAVFTPITSIAPTGFTSSPSFLLSWAGLPAGMLEANFKPVDYDNSGISKADAKGVTFAAAGLTASSAPDADGYFTATIANGFPVGAKLRAVAINGSYTQSSGTNGITGNTPRRAISVVKAVTNDDVRRTVVDSAKCSNCHEWFEAHGGSRVYEVQVCVTCHVPNKATSGRGISDAVWDKYAASVGFSSSDLSKLGEWGVSLTATDRALQLPVTTNNMKDMIHGIHAGRDRVTPFQDARDRTTLNSTTGVVTGAITLLDLRRMDFPGKLNNCQTCHKAGTYSSVPSAAMTSTYESINAAYALTQTTANAKASYATVNPDDSVVSPYTASCVSCHDALPAKAHMRSNGGQIEVARSSITPFNESCATCHGTGKDKDVAVVHK